MGPVAQSQNKRNSNGNYQTCGAANIVSNQGAIMQELKPVAWIEGPEVERLATGELAQVWPVEWEDAQPLYAIPATHRVVPVELLESAVIAAYLSCPEISLELKAIIDKDKP
jgi:hypothetical protein